MNKDMQRADQRSPTCIHCGSDDTEIFDVGEAFHHVECNSCYCAFPWPRPTIAVP